jgi:DUF4097 and DUF4098 domain-containing protein YvlB
MAGSLIFFLLLMASPWQTATPAGQKTTGVKTPIVERSEKQFAFYPGGKIEIIAAAPGSVVITGWDQSMVRVEMEKIYYYVSAEEAQALAKRYPARVTYTSTSARILTAGELRPGATLEINVRVFVPRERTDFTIKMVKGDLSIGALRGSVEANLEEGNIATHELAGYVSLSTKRGDLAADFSGARWSGYGFWGKTSMGAIDVRLPVDFSAALQLGTKNGKISVDYPEQIVEGESVPLKIAEKKKACSLTSPIGTGGAPINLMTLAGNIVLASKR